MYWFYRIAATKYHKLVAENRPLSSSVLEARSPKPRCHQAHASSETCREDSFLASPGFWCFLAILGILGL